VGEATGGKVKGALAINLGLTGETIGLIAAASGTDITQSHLIVGIQSSFTNYSNIIGDVVNHYDFYDNRTFFEDALGWDFDTVWEMRDYYDFPVAKGTGTDFIPINNAEELHSITSGNYVLMDNIDLSVFNGGVWTPISFSGTLHGNNKKITNLRTLGGGLITGSGSVRHLTIENFHLTYINGGPTGAAPLSGSFSVRDVHTSGVIDYASDANMGFNTAAVILTGSGSVSDSSFTGVIKIREGVDGFTGVAGIRTGAGSVSGSKSSGRIEIQNSASDIPGSARAAGIAEAAGSTGNSGRVRSSYSDMDIVVRQTGSADTRIARSQVGGLSVYSSSNTFNNYFAGSIDISSTASYGHAGGIAARIGVAGVDRHILKTNLVLTDSITVDDSTRNNYGRVVGRIAASAVTVENYALPTLAPGVGKITGNSSSSATVGNGTDLPIPMSSIDSAFLKSLDWDMSLWKPVVPGTLPKLWWEE
jgi:hypothetical protein